MKKTLRELLTEYALQEDWGTDDATLEELLREVFPVVWEGNEDRRRWRINYEVVCKIIDDNQERYFKYTACKGTNDNSWEDAGYTFEGIDNVIEVYPKEVTTIIYTHHINKEKTNDE